MAAFSSISDSELFSGLARIFASVEGWVETGRAVEGFEKDIVEGIDLAPLVDFGLRLVDPSYVLPEPIRTLLAQRADCLEMICQFSCYQDLPELLQKKGIQIFRPFTEEELAGILADEEDEEMSTDSPGYALTGLGRGVHEAMSDVDTLPEMFR